MADSFSASTRNADNGFFGTIGTALGDVLGKVGSEVLPVWAAQQLGVGNNPTAAISNPTIQNLGNTPGAQNIANYGAQTASQSILPGIPNNTLLVVGLGGIALYLLLTKM